MEKFPLMSKDYTQYGYQKLMQNGGPILDEMAMNGNLVEENGYYEQDGCKDMKNRSQLIKKIKGIGSNGCHSLAHKNGLRNGETPGFGKVADNCCNESMETGFLVNGDVSEAESCCYSKENEKGCLDHEKQRVQCCNGGLENCHENGGSDDGEGEHARGRCPDEDYGHAHEQKRANVSAINGCCRSDSHADDRGHCHRNEKHAHKQHHANEDHLHGHEHEHEHANSTTLESCCTFGGEHGHGEGKHAYGRRHAKEDHVHVHKHADSSATKGCCKSDSQTGNLGGYEQIDNCCVCVPEDSIKSEKSSNKSIDDDIITATMITTRLRIQNICCGQEADLIKSALEPVDGVLSLSVNIIGRTAVVRHNPALLSRGSLLKVLNGLHLGVSIIDSGKSSSEDNSFVKSLILQVLLLILIITLYSAVIYGFVNNFPWTQWVAIALISIGSVPILFKAFSNWRRQIFVDINLLMLMAIIGISFLKQWLEGSTVVLIFYTAEILQSYCFYRVEKAVSGLIVRSPRRAVLADTKETVEITDVGIGTRLAICEGDNIPLDGIVIKGTGSVDESSITGESTPIAKNNGDYVYSCTILQNGYIEIETSTTSENSTMSQIAQMVQEAQGKVTRAEEIINKFAKFYTPLILVTALLIFLIPMTIVLSKYGTITTDLLSIWGKRALIVLLIACPCALLMSVPIPMVCSITAAARNGILVKGGMHMEALAEIKTIVFDKTGTLTEGRFQVNNVKHLSDHMEMQDVMALVVALEQKSNHPVATALISYYFGCLSEYHSEQSGKEAEAPEVTDFSGFGGLGLTGKVGKYEVAIGNMELMEGLGVSINEVHSQCIDWSSSGQTVVLIAIDHQVSMVLGMSDKLRSSAQEAVRILDELSIETVMLTGDGNGAASYMSKSIGINEVLSSMKPEDKLQWIKDRQAQRTKKDGKIAMVGDGINDVPSLSAADIGIAVASCGTALALDSSDVVLINDNLAKIPCLLNLSKYTRVIYTQNIVLALVLKFGVLIATLFSFMSLWMVVLADLLSLIIVILNGFRPLIWKDKFGAWR